MTGNWICRLSGGALGLCSCFFFPKEVYQVIVKLITLYYLALYSGGSSERAWGARPPSFRSKWGPKARKKFFRRLPPRYLRVWMTAPPLISGSGWPHPPLSQGLDDCAPPYLRVWMTAPPPYLRVWMTAPPLIWRSGFATAVSFQG